MITYETIIYQKQGHVWTITLNRPQRLNALSAQLIAELSQALDEIEMDDQVRVVIITGAPRPDGRPCFCAGADLKEIAEAGHLMEEEHSILDCIEGLVKSNENPVQTFFVRLERLKKPTIAVIDGVCTTGGIELAMSCDIRLVSETAQISDLHVKNLGRIGGGGATALLPRIVGMAKAKEMVFTGDPINGREAWRLGFANQVFPPDRLMDGAKELAAKIAARHPAAIRMAKASINATQHMDLDQALRYSYLCRIALFPSVEPNERTPPE